MPPCRPAGVSGGGDGRAELLVGRVLGWLARLPALALAMAGAVVSDMLGLSSVVQPDPALGGQSSALARLFGLLAPVLVLSTGLYALPLQALAGSYRLFPPGSVMPAGPLAESVTAAVSAALRPGAAPGGAVHAGGAGVAGRRWACWPAGAAGAGVRRGRCRARSWAGWRCSRLLAAPILAAWTDGVSGGLVAAAGPVTCGLKVA